MVLKAQEDSESKTKGMNRELVTLINSKANYQDIEHVNLIKTNKADTE